MHGKKKSKSECNFIGFKNNRLNYKCKESGKKCTKLINEAFKNFLITFFIYTRISMASLLKKNRGKFRIINRY